MRQDADAGKVHMRTLLLDRVVKGTLVVLAPLALTFIVLHILWGMLAAGLLFPWLPSRGRDALVRFWSRILLVALGIRLHVHRDPAAKPIAATRGALLLMNHISWVDVFVIAAVTPARFVAKAEVARWPLLGRFAASVGTVYVERGRRHAIAHVNHTVAQRLRLGQSIGIFPEGTTTDGSRLLRFHANLVQAALEAGAPVIPLGLQYRQDGQPSTAAAFIGDMNLVQSIWRIVLAPRLTAHLYWLPAVACDGLTRQAIGARAREAIGAALELPEVTAVDELGDSQPDRPLATAS